MQDEKIAAIGIAVRRWVSYHGVALNVNTDMSYFDLILPCGIRGLGVTSMERLLGRSVPLAEVADEAVRAFARGFGFHHYRRAGETVSAT